MTRRKITVHTELGMIEVSENRTDLALALVDALGAPQVIDLTEYEARTEYAECQRCERPYARTVLYWDGWEFTGACTCGGIVKHAERRDRIG